MTERHCLSIALAMLAAATFPLAAFAYTPPSFVPLTLKKPDLTIGGVKTSAVLPCAHGVPPLRFLVNVENVGKLDYSPAPANRALTLHGPSHTVITDLPFIAAGGSVKVEVDYTPHSVENAKYPNTTFKATVNPSHRIVESNYDNNTYVVHATVLPVCPSPSTSAAPLPPSPAGY